MKIQLIRYHDIDNINTRLAKSLDKRQGALPPLGLAYIAAALEGANHEVEIIDAVALQLSKDDVRQKIRKFNPRLIGITAMTPTFRGAQEVAQLAKEEGALTVIGGVHMALFPRETLSYDYFDFGISGEGEDSIVALCEAIEQNKSYEDIPGLSYRKDGDIFDNPAYIVPDIDKLPLPAYHLLPMEKYSSIIGLHPVSTMMGSRGCPYLCGFCFKTPSDKKYRTRAPKLIVDEIEFLIKNYKIKEIMFYDDLMTPAYVEGLSNEIIRRNVKISWQTPQRVNLVNPELLKLMAKAGCRLLRFGVEQGDPDMMELVEKRITVEKVKEAFQWAHDAGIETFAYFIVGYINETEKTMRATIDLAKELNPKYVMFTKAVPLPQTPLMDQAVEQGFLSNDYWKRFVLNQEVEAIPPLVPNADEWVARAYREFYLRPNRIIRQISQIKSLRDIQKNLDGFIGILGFKMSEKVNIDKTRTHQYAQTHL